MCLSYFILESSLQECMQELGEHVPVFQQSCGYVCWFVWDLQSCSALALGARMLPVTRLFSLSHPQLSHRHTHMCMCSQDCLFPGAKLSFVLSRQKGYSFTTPLSFAAALLFCLIFLLINQLTHTVFIAVTCKQ